MARFELSEVRIQLTAKDNASGVFKSHAEALRHAQEGYESLGQYMRRTSSEAQSAAAEQKKVGAAARDAGDSADTASNQWGGLFKTFTLANLASSAVQKAIQFTTDTIRNAKDAAAEYELRIRGLNSAGAAFGHSQDEINAALQRVTADGLLGMSTAMTTLKTLLSDGLDMDTAITLLERFKDEAASGKSETIDYGTAVQNLAQAWKMESSELGDRSGHQDNFSDAIERGAAALGKQTSALTESEREQAKLIGYLQQGAYTAGSAAGMADTYAGSLAREAAAAEKASVSLGTTLIPASAYATESFTSFLGALNSTAEGTQDLQAYLVTLAAIARTVAQSVIGSAQIIWGALNSIATFSLDPLNQGINQAADGFVDTWNDAFTQYERIYTQSTENQLDAVDDLLKDMDRSYDANAVKRAQQEQDLTRQFQRQMEQRKRSFEESLRDMIIAHRDKSRSIEADIAKENAAYAKSAAERKNDYDEDITALEERNAEKLASIREQIADEERKGILDNGKFYSTANQEKLAKLQQSLAEEERKHQVALEKRRAQYAEDIAEDKARHDEKLQQLQQSLNEELAILEQHRSDVARIGEAQKEDDISRLKRQFAEQNAEATRNFQEQLAKARSAGSSQGTAYGNEYLTKLREANAKALEQQRNAGTEQTNVARDQGAKAGSSWLEGFSRSMENFRSNNAWGRMIDELNRGQEQFVRGIAGFFGLDQNAVSRMFTGRATGGVVRPGEITLVGERGPEIAQFPAGTRIIPADQTKQMLSQPSSGATINYTVGTQVIQTPTDFQAQLQWLAMRTR